MFLHTAREGGIACVATRAYGAQRTNDPGMGCRGDE